MSARVASEPTSVASDVQSSIVEYLLESHTRVDDLYRIDRDAGFDPGAPPPSEALAFTADRLAAGSSMLATLWWSAWLEGTR